MAMKHLPLSAGITLVERLCEKIGITQKRARGSVKKFLNSIICVNQMYKMSHKDSGDSNFQANYRCGYAKEKNKMGEYCSPGDNLSTIKNLTAQIEMERPPANVSESSATTFLLPLLNASKSRRSIWKHYYY
jgi:hypothetical protein